MILSINLKISSLETDRLETRRDEPPQAPAQVALPAAIVQEDYLKYCIAKRKRTLPS